MALSFKDPETETLARRVAALTGESLTQAVKGALRDRLKKEETARGRRPLDLAAINAITDHFAALPVFDTRSDDEILGYDENGLPS